MRLNASVLNGIELFAQTGSDAVADAVRLATARRIARGRTVFMQGEPATHCHALVSGRIRVSQASVEGKKVTMRYVGPGGLFGALGVFAGGTYLADAVAVTDSVVAEWSAAHLTELMMRHPQIGLNALRMVSLRLRELQERLREVVSDTVERRLARSILRLARHAGQRTDQGIEITIPLSRRDLAEIAGATHFTASRTLSAWAGRGILKGRRNRIIVCDPNALESMAQGTATAPPASIPE